MDKLLKLGLVLTIAGIIALAAEVRTVEYSVGSGLVIGAAFGLWALTKIRK